MKWLIPVFLRIVIGDILANSLIKKLSHFGSPTARIFWTFFFCTLGSLLLAIHQGITLFTLPNGVVFGVGLLNSIAAYCEWRAFQISMSKKSLFSPAADLISIFLGYLFLGEAQYLNFWLVVGILLAVFAVSLIAYDVFRSRTALQQTVSSRPQKLFLYVFTFSVIWGITGFLMRFLAIKVAVKAAAFFTCWYAGSFVGTYLFGVFNTPLRTAPKITIHGILASALLALLVAVSRFMNYWSLELAPITIVQPIFLVSSMVVPLLIGLFVFGERKVLHRLEVLGITMGLVSGMLVALSFM